MADTGGPYEYGQLAEIKLSAAESYDEHSEIVSYKWTIEPVEKPAGESIYPLTLTGKDATLKLEDIGKYTVRLDVVD